MSARLDYTQWEQERIAYLHLLDGDRELVTDSTADNTKGDE
jgi:hypothetical protein